MKLSDIEELLDIDQMIIDLQSKLSDLYEQRRSIVSLSKSSSKKQPLSSISNLRLSTIDLNLDDQKPFKI